MDKRLRKNERLLKVQEQLHKIAEWKLVSLRRQVTDLQETQTVLIQALNSDDALHGLFVEPAARRLHALAGQEEQVRQARDAQNEVVLDRAMQVKRTERVVDALALEYQRTTEKRDYLALLDGFASKSDASLP
ncbi:hypothetical protein [Microvirga alba]|uniref:Flagellar export protein FliJ n=1 Tax=Microvirga alba TaxID=2791025 RepID=A0A931FUI3_9HYPH|nr:hypothetical protein [Microvirga alba]MBF9235641.1 hypothetical protein [Microvirga alba]